MPFEEILINLTPDSQLRIDKVLGNQFIDIILRPTDSKSQANHPPTVLNAILGEKHVKISVKGAQIEILSQNSSLITLKQLDNNK